MDKHQLELTRVVREVALRSFGSARPAPMKPWIFGSDLELLAISPAGEAYFSCCVRRGKDAGGTMSV